MIDKLFKTVFDLSISSSFLILIALMLRPLAKARFAPRFRVFMWIMVMIKLILPFSFSTSFSVYNFLPDIIQTDNILEDIGVGNINEADNSFSGIYSEETIISSNYPSPIKDNTSLEKIDSKIFSDNKKQINSDDTSDSLSKTTYSSKPMNTLSLIWFIGFICLLATYLIINILFYIRIKAVPLTVSKAVKQYTDMWRSKLDLSSDPGVKETSLVKGPAVYGFFKPILLFPREMERNIGDEDLSAVVLHELSHIKRKDTILGIISLLVKFIHWFNPLVWYGFSLLKNDIEASCDSMALSQLDVSKHKRYGITLLNLSAERPREISVFGMAGILERKKKITERLKEISLFKRKGYTVSLSAVIILIVIGIFFFSGAMQHDTLPKDVNNIEIPKDNATEIVNTVEALDVYKGLESYNILNDQKAQSAISSTIDDVKLESLKSWLNSYISSLDKMDQAVYKALQNLNQFSKDDVPKFVAWHEFGRKLEGNSLSLFVWAYSKDYGGNASGGVNLPVRIDMLKTPLGKFVVLDTHVAGKFSYYAKNMKMIMDEFTDDITGIHQTDIIKTLIERVNELEKEAMGSIEKENVRVAKDQGILLDGYLAELTTKRQFDNARIDISADVISHKEFQNQKYISILQSNDKELIREIYDLINHESLWEEKFDDNDGIARGQLNDIVNISFSLVFESKEGLVYIGLGINPNNHKMYAECIWHKTGSGKIVKILSCNNKDLYPIIMKKLMDVDIKDGWNISGNLNRDDFICYSVKDSYLINETLCINAIIRNNDTESITLPKNISGWIKMTSEDDYLSWDNIKIDLPEDSNVLREGDQILFNLIKVNLERSDIKPGIYTIEGMIGDNTIDKFEVEINEP